MTLREKLIDGLSISGASECWEWKRGRSEGYGTIYVKGDHFLVHRVMYELYRGPIPEGRQIDHLCRNRGCGNPSHMEVVTTRVNILRGMSPSAVNARKTHCVHGHEFTAENTKPRRDGSRICRECERKLKREWARRNRLVPAVTRYP
jgi:HNH endonuclease